VDSAAHLVQAAVGDRSTWNDSPRGGCGRMGRRPARNDLAMSVPTTLMHGGGRFVLNATGPSRGEGGRRRRRSTTRTGPPPWRAGDSCWPAPSRGGLNPARTGYPACEGANHAESRPPSVGRLACLLRSAGEAARSQGTVTHPPEVVDEGGAAQVGHLWLVECGRRLAWRGSGQQSPGLTGSAPDRGSESALQDRDRTRAREWGSGSGHPRPVRGRSLPGPLGECLELELLGRRHVARVGVGDASM
jgi:hypothetical protein